MAKGKVSKGGSSKEKVRTSMKLVTSDVCEVCKTPCERGMAYAERMREPGAVGKGVPCILTKPKG
ncbi:MULTISPECIES: hypothetical protein [unclassified Paenibacillus]|uniref:Uncharacterized protein n=1 Tax=Paenibacillus provencensis TaxID=441151 RepID=A0ABW3PY80_9BACL|nr:MULTISPECIES: hypothetical protein [unclassified Paenibacillus]MCM3126310.1 hypothetical protein [Paenibacillus sp. MER 78]SFS60957.1 hypothetical protein SAMN04488601_1012534 [Paenibacillus sp. 453mf]